MHGRKRSTHAPLTPHTDFDTWQSLCEAASDAAALAEESNINMIVLFDHEEVCVCLTGAFFLNKISLSVSFLRLDTSVLCVTLMINATLFLFL